MEQGGEIVFVVQYQVQVDFCFGFEVFVDCVFVDVDGICDYFDCYVVFFLFEEQFEGGIENFLFMVMKFMNFVRFFLYKKIVRLK